MKIIHINTVTPAQGGVQTYGLGDDGKLYIYMNLPNQPTGPSAWIEMNEATKYIQQPAKE